VSHIIATRLNFFFRSPCSIWMVPTHCEIRWTARQVSSLQSKVQQTQCQARNKVPCCTQCAATRCTSTMGGYVTVRHEYGVPSSQFEAVLFIAGNPRAVGFSIIPDPGCFFVVGTLDSICASTSPLGGSGCSSPNPDTALGPVLNATVLSLPCVARHWSWKWLLAPSISTWSFLVKCQPLVGLLVCQCQPTVRSFHWNMHGHSDVSLTQTSRRLPSQHNPSIGLILSSEWQCMLHPTKQKPGWK
jgi:hypothetical protein